MQLLPGRDADRPALEAFLRRHGTEVVARRGELVRATDHPAVLAWSGEDLVGVATYVITGSSCELLTLHADERSAGIGTAFVREVREQARAAGCRRLWVVTTNDNLGALRFYQRRGFRLARVSPGAVDLARATHKPAIPVTGSFGIPIRDELELEADLDGDPGGELSAG